MMLLMQIYDLCSYLGVARAAQPACARSITGQPDSQSRRCCSDLRVDWRAGAAVRTDIPAPTMQDKFGCLPAGVCSAAQWPIKSAWRWAMMRRKSLRQWGARLDPAHLHRQCAAARAAADALCLARQQEHTGSAHPALRQRLSSGGAIRQKSQHGRATQRGLSCVCRPSELPHLCGGIGRCEHFMTPAICCGR
jgi:hypothetical protein